MKERCNGKAGRLVHASCHVGVSSRGVRRMCFDWVPKSVRVLVATAVQFGRVPLGKNDGREGGDLRPIHQQCTCPRFGKPLGKQ